MTWDPSKYGGIKRVRIDPSLLWIPDIVLYNRSVTVKLYQSIYLSVCNLHIYRLPKNCFGIQSSRGYFTFLHFEIGGPRVKTNRDEFLDNTYDTDRI